MLPNLLQPIFFKFSQGIKLKLIKIVLIFQIYYENSAVIKRYSFQCCDIVSRDVIIKFVKTFDSLKNLSHCFNELPESQKVKVPAKLDFFSTR